VENVSARDDRGALAVRSLSLEIGAGEVLGIAGVDGNGQKELGEVIAGQRRVESGTIAVDQLDVTNRGVAAANRAGIGYVTDDRLGEGAVPGCTVAENLVLKSIGRSPFSKRSLWLDRSEMDRNATVLVERFDVRATGVHAPINLLSGGNVQKVLLARELALDPKVLVCNKPTNGLDLRTTLFVLQTLRDHADASRSVLLISSELDELLEICDRIAVIYRGELVASFARQQADRETIGRFMLAGSAFASVPA
jgi:simple sugar transport system ATP-binding protein